MIIIAHITLPGGRVLWLFYGSSWFAGTRVDIYHYDIAYWISYIILFLHYYSMDDLLVSAPMYSPETDRPEYGRVYVYRNDQVKF